MSGRIEIPQQKYSIRRCTITTRYAYTFTRWYIGKVEIHPNTVGPLFYSIISRKEFNPSPSDVGYFLQDRALSDAPNLKVSPTSGESTTVSPLRRFQAPYFGVSTFPRPSPAFGLSWAPFPLAWLGSSRASARVPMNPWLLGMLDSVEDAR